MPIEKTRNADWKSGEISCVARIITSVFSGRETIDDDELDELLGSIFQRGYLIGLRTSRGTLDSMIREATTDALKK